jgi:hypothetical protein
MPEIGFHPPMGDVFSNLTLNWSTLSPVLYLLFGTIFGTWLLKKFIDTYRGND